jgi:hypothetical protein
MTRRLARAVLLALLVLITVQDQRSGARAHERPYFMPPVERDRLHGLVLKEDWAKADYARLKRAASTGDGRTGQREALFAVSHEPYSGTDQPQLTRVLTLGRTKGAAVIRVDAKDFTDYAAIAFGPQPDGVEHTLLVPGERRYFFAFKNYGYARIKKDGSVTLRGGWTGLSLPEANGPVTLNGEAARATTKEGVLLLGRAPPTALENRSEAHLPEVPITVKTTPAVVRLSARDRRIVTLTLDNTLDEPVSGWLQFDLPVGLAVEPKRALFSPIQPKFGPIQPKASATVGLTVVSSNPAAGRHTVPYRISYRIGNNGKEIRTAALPLTVMTGPTLQHVYEYPRPYYLIHSPGYTVRADMFNGLHRFLADDDDTVRLNGSPLFTFSDGSAELMSEKTIHALHLARRVSGQHHRPRRGPGALAGTLFQRPHPDPDGPRLDAVRKGLLLGAQQLVVAAGTAALDAHYCPGRFWQGSGRTAGGESESGRG